MGAEETLRLSLICRVTSSLASVVMQRERMPKPSIFSLLPMHSRTMSLFLLDKQLEALALVWCCIGDWIAST